MLPVDDIIFLQVSAGVLIVIHVQCILLLTFTISSKVTIVFRAFEWFVVYMRKTMISNM